MTKLIDQFGIVHFIDDGQNHEIKGIVQVKKRRSNLYAFNLRNEDIIKRIHKQLIKNNGK